MIGYRDNEDRYREDCPKERDIERLLDHADYLRDEAKDRRICPPDPSPEEIAADARDAAEDMKEIRQDRLYAFIESIVDANGPYPYLNGTSVVYDAYQILTNNPPER